MQIKRHITAIETRSSQRKHVYSESYILTLKIERVSNFIIIHGAVHGSAAPLHVYCA